MFAITDLHTTFHTINIQYVRYAIYRSTKCQPLTHFLIRSDIQRLVHETEHPPCTVWRLRINGNLPPATAQFHAAVCT